MSELQQAAQRVVEAVPAALAALDEGLVRLERRERWRRVQLGLIICAGILGIVLFVWVAE